MKRILVLNYEFPPIGGGGSTASYDIARRFSEIGCMVDVVTMRYRGLPAFEEKDGMRIYRVWCLRSKLEICHPWEQLTYLLSAYWLCRKLIRKEHYDVCHAHFILPTGVLALWLKRHFGIPYIVTSHGSDVLNYNPRFQALYPLLAGVWKRILDGARAVTVPSSYLKQCIMREYPSFEEHRITVIPNGFEKASFLPSKKENVVAVVARLFENKGIQDLLRALKGVDLSDWKVVIAGEGPYRSALETLARELGLSNSIRFLGWLDHGSVELEKLYGKACVFVSPSYFESFNMTAVEALSADCAPLLSDIPANRALIEGEQFFFKPHDTDALRTKLVALMDVSRQNPHQPGKFRDHALTRFSWPIVMKEYERVFDIQV